MKKSLVLFALLIFSLIGFTQPTVKKDVVKLKNGSIIKGSVTTAIKPDEPITIETADGSIFVYKMQEIEEMTKEEVIIDNKAEVNTTNNDNGYWNSCSLATNDAKENYDGKGSLAGVTVATTLLLSPIVGIIPAAIGASSEPSFENINCPRPTEYQNNIDYRNCYNSEAKRIKSRKAWSALGVSTAINIGLYIILFAL